jgi:hypothetical protein
MSMSAGLQHRIGSRRIAWRIKMRWRRCEGRGDVADVVGAGEKRWGDRGSRNKRRNLGAEPFAFLRAQRSNIGIIEPAQGQGTGMHDPKGERERERVKNHPDRVAGPDWELVCDR